MIEIEKGSIVGEWEVIETAPPSSKGRARWLCKCKCGRRCQVEVQNLKSGGSTRCRYCAMTVQAGSKHKNWKGCGRISGTVWTGIRQSAKKRNLTLEVDVRYGWELYQNQNGKCALTGKPIEFAKSAADHFAGKTTASLDRIDSSLGYIVGNVQWVLKEINHIKSDTDQSRFLELCEMVYLHNRKR